jgi:hypothetical protein
MSFRLRSEKRFAAGRRGARGGDLVQQRAHRAGVAAGRLEDGEILEVARQRQRMIVMDSRRNDATVSVWPMARSRRRPAARQVHSRRPISGAAISGFSRRAGRRAEVIAAAADARAARFGQLPIASVKITGGDGHRTFQGRSSTWYGLG